MTGGVTIWVGDRPVSLSPAMSIGKGGEAEVYALDGARALKIFKAPDHPDFAAMPVEQRAAAARIAEHQTKLGELAARLGGAGRAVTPLELARGGRPAGSPLVGYVMPLIEGAEPLYRFSDPRFRRARVPGQRVVSILRDLHDSVRQIHAAGAVIGDFNDLNVLVRDTRAFVIDADSFQFDRYRCAVFTERFVDPLLCDAGGSTPLLVRPHNTDSDWYAFAILAMRSLLCVGPYGGVHRPARGSRRIAHAARPLHRVTVFSDEVTYPKPALHWRLLPDELLDHLSAVFERDRRGPFPDDLLETLRFTRCRSCGAEHARSSCPDCARARPPAPPVRVRGSVRAIAIEGAEAAALRARHAERHANDRHRFWIAGSSLWFDGALGDVRLGQILGGRTRFWVGDRLGAGFYSAGALTVGFVFDAARPIAGNGINDQITLPPLRGQLMDASCAIGSDRAWLFAVEQVGGAVVGHCSCVDARGQLLATVTAPVADLAWLAAGPGACATGPYLFVATDDGVARLEIDGGDIVETRTFADTEPFVDASTQLAITDRGLCAMTRGEVIALQMK